MLELCQQQFNPESEKNNYHMNKDPEEGFGSEESLEKSLKINFFPGLHKDRDYIFYTSNGTEYCILSVLWVCMGNTG